MADDFEPASQWSRVESFLRDRGAADMPHPGGTLLEHLGRVRRLLADWGADPVIQMAGLCHATYGTDGFDQWLQSATERHLLTELIGDRAEALVYLYASCDRGAVYPQLGAAQPVVFRDRFTGTEHVPNEADLRAFMEITAANELDVMAHNDELASRYGAELYRIFTRSADLLSTAARNACTKRLGWSASPVRITGFDHLVLTVTNIERTIDFYQRVLGLRPVTFAAGRRALAFGTSKINLHEVGSELLPRAARPTPGSADLCLLTDLPQSQLLQHLTACDVRVEEGPVPRTGAQGPITSTYLRDPDGNLIEISTYGPGAGELHN
ncbi:VOC family protein [Streptomyces sp. NPDC001020]